MSGEDDFVESRVKEVYTVAEKIIASQAEEIIFLKDLLLLAYCLVVGLFIGCVYLYSSRGF